VIHSQHGFLMYAIAARAVGATPVAVPERQLTTDVDAVIAAVTPRTKAIMLANPNNPTGSLLPQEAIARLIKGVPDHVVIVLDAAYAEYVDDPAYTAGEDMVAAHDNVVMLRTFSKVHGLAALRLGWGYFPPAMAEAINRLRGPFNVSVPAQAAGIAALADDAFVQTTVEKNNRERTRLAQALDQLGLGVSPSAGNFLLVDFGARAPSARLALKERGVFVRQMEAYGLPHHLRITVGLKADNDRLLEELEDVLGLV
jgi:histidinol-phosphate aminotransferase